MNEKNNTHTKSHADVKIKSFHRRTISSVVQTHAHTAQIVHHDCDCDHPPLFLVMQMPHDSCTPCVHVFLPRPCMTPKNQDSSHPPNIGLAATAAQQRGRVVSQVVVLSSVAGNQHHLAATAASCCCCISGLTRSDCFCLSCRPSFCVLPLFFSQS